MLGREGLKEAIMFTLKAKYCHHFHKPCAVCIVNVLECFPLSSVYGLDDLYHKCLKWITKNFSKVCPTRLKAFATLPTDLLDKCYQHHIVNLTDTVYACVHCVLWSESVARMCRRLISVHFAAPKSMATKWLLPYLTTHPTLPSEPRGRPDVEWAPPENVCRAYGYFSTFVKEVRNQPSKKRLRKKVIETFIYCLSKSV